MAVQRVALTPPIWVREPKWTPAQQREEMQRRTVVYDKIIPLDSDFSPLPSDIIIVTAPKSGTTWLSHICHQLRTGGAEPDFVEQPDVVPMINGHVFLYGKSPEDIPQPAAPPRLFNTHLPYSAIPKGGKFVVCYRDPADALYSLYHYWDSMLSLKGRVSLEIFCECSYINTKAQLVELVDWWKHRHDEDVLLFIFADLLENHERCVREIAQFMRFSKLSEEILQRVVHTTTHKEMVRHHSKFSGRKLNYILAKHNGDDPPTEISGRVRQTGGKSGQGNLLPEHIKHRLEKEWQEVITAELGFKNIAEMHAAWKAERNY